MDIKRILNKRKWTGKEVGQAVIASYLHELKQAKKGSIETSPLFTETELRQMYATLSTEKDLTAFNCYTAIEELMSKGSLYIEMQVQAYQHGMANYFANLRICQKAERMVQIEALNEENAPALVTETQYNTLREKCREELRAKKKSFNELLLDSLAYFLDNPNNTPATIKTLLEKAESTPAINKRIIEEFTKEDDAENTEGYYLLPDGRKLEQKNEKDIKHNGKFLDTYYKEHSPLYKETLERYNYLDDLRESDKATLYTMVKKQKVNKICYNSIKWLKEAYKEIVGGNLSSDLSSEEIVKLENSVKAGAYVYFLEDVARFLPYLNKIDRLANRLIEGDKENILNLEWKPAPSKWEYTLKDTLPNYTDGELKKDCPALYKALEAYIKEQIPALKDVKPARYSKPVISSGELGDLNYLDFSEAITPSNEQIKAKLENHNGRKYASIAIILDPKEWDIDNQGNYISKPKKTSNQIDSLEGIGLDPEAVDDLKSYRVNLIDTALRAIEAWNTLLELLNDIYGVNLPNEPLEQFSYSIETYNQTLYDFCYEVKDRTTKRGLSKRKLLTKTFTPVCVEEYKPTPESVEVIRKKLEETAFTLEGRRLLRNFLLELVIPMSGELKKTTHNE